MNIHVKISVTDVFDQEKVGKAATYSLDNEFVQSNTATELELVMEHITNALYACGYTEKQVNDYIRIRR